MKINRLIIIASLLAGSAASAIAGPFASVLEDYSPGPSQYDGNAYYTALFKDPQKALGRPYGGPVHQPSNASVVTLGDGGSIMLAFDRDITDDPRNPGGYDFIVFSNAYFIGSNERLRWQEPAFVEISQDKVNWYLILPNILPADLTASDVARSSTALNNYAEYTPTLALPANRTAEEFYTVPDRQSVADNTELLKIDAVSGGGDAFDIADAVVQVSPGSGVPLLVNGKPVKAGIASFRYIRLTDAVREGTSDPELGEVSAEIDAVAAVTPAVSVGSARRLGDGGYAVIWGAKVTAVFPGEGFFIEQPDRSAGLRIASAAAVQEGDLIALTGHVTGSADDRVIADALVTALESGSTPAPVGITNKTAGSDMLPGMLVKVWGNRIDGGSGWMLIDDGSGNPVRVDYGTLTTVPTTAKFITAIGILTRDTDGTPAVRIRRTEDIAF